MMTKKMRKVPVEPSPSSFRDCFAQDANKRFRHQSLLQDYMELLKETEAKKRKLEETRQKKLQLLADVRFLRRKYKLLSENPCQETLCRLKKQPHPLPSQSQTISRSMKSHVPNELLSLQEKYRLSEAASTSTSVIDSLLINPSQYQYKNKKRKNTPLSLCAEHPLDVFVPREVPSQDWSYGVEDTNARNSLMLEENQVSLMNEEEMEMLELEENYPKMEKLNRFSAEGGYRNKFVISRDVAKNSNKARKRKISWQDQAVKQAESSLFDSVQGKHSVSNDNVRLIHVLANLASRRQSAHQQHLLNYGQTCWRWNF